MKVCPTCSTELNAGICPRCIGQLGCEYCRQVWEVDLSDDDTPEDDEWRRCKCGRLGVPVADLTFYNGATTEDLRLLDEQVRRLERLPKAQLVVLFRMALTGYAAGFGLTLAETSQRLTEWVAEARETPATKRRRTRIR